jgi:hypothetical protein
MSDITGQSSTNYNPDLSRYSGFHPSQAELYITASNEKPSSKLDVYNQEILKAKQGQAPYAIMDTMEQTLNNRKVIGNQALPEAKMSGRASLPFQPKRTRGQNPEEYKKILSKYVNQTVDTRIQKIIPTYLP